MSSDARVKCQQGKLLVKNMNPLRKYGFFGLVVAVTVVLDQFTKSLVVKSIPLYHTVTVIPGFFNLSHILNRGGAFGFMAQSDSPARHWLFLAATLAAMGLILYFYHQTPNTHRWLGFALALIFGGAVGNALDRLRDGKVIDFLDVYVGAYHWPSFNVADSAVTVGVAIFIIHLVLKKMPY
jgi:signal peptidase II